MNKDPQRITKVDETITNNLAYKNIKFPLSQNDYSKIEKKNNISISLFSYEDDLVYPGHISKFED